jgi:hypothetical protein
MRAETFAGEVTTGFSLSSTVTFWVAVELSPAEFVAVQVIVVEPFGYAASSSSPSLLALEIVTPVASPLTVATPVLTIALHVPTPALLDESLTLEPLAADIVGTTMSAGATRTGGTAGRGNEKRTASFVSAKNERTLPGTNSASVPSAFSMPWVTG